jgi:hypothetical protein
MSQVRGGGLDHRMDVKNSMPAHDLVVGFAVCVRSAGDRCGLEVLRNE